MAGDNAPPAAARRTCHSDRCTPVPPGTPGSLLARLLGDRTPLTLPTGILAAGLLVAAAASAASTLHAASELHNNVEIAESRSGVG